jgi:hypothetical protein
MGTLLDLASLVVVPSGYKEDKIYSVVPTDGSGDLDFTRASDATRVNSAGLIESVATGVPRLDYSQGSCPSLLLEPQRTNLLTHSEQFDNAYWTKTRINTTGTPPWVNVGVAPNGTTAAEKIIANTDTGGAHAVTSTAFNSTVAAYTASIFVKSAEFSRIRIRESNGLASATYNLANQTFTLSTGTSANITSLANDWYRISVTFSYASILSSSIAFDIVDNSGNTTFAGNDSDGIFIWGAQLEAGSYPTSYIPTLGTSVTRVKDQALLSNSAALPTAYPFTLYSEIELRATGDEFAISLLDDSASTVHYVIGNLFTNEYGLICRNVTSTVVSSGVTPTAGTHKMCGVFTDSTLKLFVDGVLLGSVANGQTFNAAANDLVLGQVRIVSDIGGRNSVKQALVFNSALTDTQAIELTTI